MINFYMVTFRKLSQGVSNDSIVIGAEQQVRQWAESECFSYGYDDYFVGFPETNLDLSDLPATIKTVRNVCNI